MRAPDLRLLAPAVAMWSGAAAAPVTRPSIAVVVAAVAASGGAAVLLSGRRPALLALAAVLLAFGGGLFLGAERIAARESGELPALARTGASVTVGGVLTTDPHLDRAGTLWVLTVRAEHLDAGGRAWSVRQPVLVLGRGAAWSGLLPGQRLQTSGRLAAVGRGDSVSALLLARGPPAAVGAPGAVAGAAGRVRSGLRRAAAPLPGGSSGLLPGLVDGDTGGLPAAVFADFQTTGLTHVVAVSGANCVAVLAAAIALARIGRAGPRLTAVLAGIALLGFVILARPSPSVLRAAGTGLLGLVAVLTGREAAALPILSGTVLILLVVSPDLSRQAGFALSVLSTAGLLLLAPGWRDRLVGRGWPAWAAEAVAVPAAAQAACAPVLAVLGAGIGPVSIPANMLAVPAVPWATVAGVAAAVLGTCCPPLANLAAWVAFPACWWLLTVAHVAARIPGASLPWPDGLPGGVLLACLLPVVIAMLRRRTARRVLLTLSGVVGVAATLVTVRP
jgi:competence protein ComEC